MQTPENIQPEELQSLPKAQLANSLDVQRTNKKTGVTTRYPGSLLADIDRGDVLAMNLFDVDTDSGNAGIAKRFQEGPVVKIIRRSDGTYEVETHSSSYILSPFHLPSEEEQKPESENRPNATKFTFRDIYRKFFGQ